MDTANGNDDLYDCWVTRLIKQSQYSRENIEDSRRYDKSCYISFELRVYSPMCITNNTVDYALLLAY